MYLLDTDTIVYSMKGHAAVQTNLRAHLNALLNICTVTLMELYCGAYKFKEATSDLAKIKTIENSLPQLSKMKFERKVRNASPTQEKHGIDFETAKFLWNDGRRGEIEMTFPDEKRWLS